MNRHYRSLPHGLLSPGTRLPQYRNPNQNKPSLADEAIKVYTDFDYTRPFSTSPAATIEQINATMIACGVRLLFVADAEGVLDGLVTYTDLFGEKPVRYMREHGGSREDIVARDIMTPLQDLETLALDDIKKACIGDVVTTIRTAGRQHMLVSRRLENGAEVIAGLFSSTHIEKQLGIRIELSSRANSFADLERALA